MYENGGNYVSAPIYNDVAAYSTYANSTVPSGATVITVHISGGIEVDLQGMAGLER